MIFVFYFLSVVTFFNIIKRSVTSRLHRNLTSHGISAGSVLTELSFLSKIA